jgi:hypothetical protein
MESVYCTVRPGYLYVIDVVTGLRVINVCTFNAWDDACQKPKDFWWFGLLVICHALWSSVSYCSALSRTPSAFDYSASVTSATRNLLITHWTCIFYRKKKGHVCKQVQCFELMCLWIDRTSVLEGVGTEGRGWKTLCNAATDPTQPSNSWKVPIYWPLELCEGAENWLQGASGTRHAIQGPFNGI